MATRKEFLGRGWSFPFRFDPATGQVAMSEFEENIRQSITIILGTRPGERQMLPKFGCRIHELLFAPNTPVTARRAKRYVEEALAMWEPRIEVIDVRSEPDPAGAIRLQVIYRIPSTGATETLLHVASSR
jgi:phage baseplate assembly protein W